MLDAVMRASAAGNDPASEGRAREWMQTLELEPPAPLRCEARLVLGEGLRDPIVRENFRRPASSGPVSTLRMRDVTLLPILGLVFKDGAAVAATSYGVTQREEAEAAICLASHHRRIEGRRVYSGLNRWCANYYHILTQVVPAVASYAGEPGFGEGTLLLGVADPLVVRALELAGVAVPRIEQLDPLPPVDMADLTVSSLLAEGDEPSLFSRAIYERMARRAMAGAAGGSPEMIYVWRADATARPMRNEDELVEMLAGHGVEPVVLGALGLEEQIRLFRGARLVIGPHGAGLANVVFASPGAVLYELLPEHYLNPCVCRLTAFQDVHYWCDVHPSEPRRGVWRHLIPWRVDVAAVERRLAEIVAAHGLGGGATL
jgi:hypothetical protein